MIRSLLGRLALTLLLVASVAACSARSGTSQSLDVKAAGSITRTAGSTVVVSHTIPAGTSAAGTVGDAQLTTDLQASLVALYAKANPAVVTIDVPNVGTGSGFLYDAEGHIVTNHHVAAMGSGYEVTFWDGTRTRATLVGSDAGSDLAVLKVESVPSAAQPLVLATTEPQVGQFAIAIGNPFGEAGSMSFGIISGLGRSLPARQTLNSNTTYTLPGIVQTDAPINPGNSGGPLLNLAGEVIGVNVAIASTSGSNSGVGFSIPVAAVKLIVPSLVANGNYHYSYLGALFDGDLTLADEAQYGLSQGGAYVISVTAGGPAAQAGLRGADPATGKDGDLVVAVDGQPVTDFASLNGYLVFNSQPGQTVTLTVIRGGQAVELPVTLSERP